MSEVPGVPHDEPQPSPDELTHLTINHVWRRFIGHILMDYADNHSFDATDAEIQQALNWLDALVEDFYSPGANILVPKFHGVLLRQFAEQTIPAAETVYDWSSGSVSVIYDTDGYFDSGSPTVISIPAGLPGVYRVWAFVQLKGGPSYPRIIIQSLPGPNNQRSAYIADTVVTSLFTTVTVSASLQNFKFRLAWRSANGVRDTLVQPLDTPYSLEFGCVLVGQ